MSIFDESNKITGSFFTFKKIGDEMEGTFVDKRQVPDKLNAGQMQWIYEFKGADGAIILVGGKKGIDMQMKNVRLGQVVGMRYERDIPNPNKAMKPTHVIQVYANPNLVDKDWLDNREAQGTQNEIEVTPLPQADPVADAVALFDSPEEKLEKIMTLAEIKFSVKGAEAEKAVMEKTGLPFLESNYDEILEKLKN